MIEQAADELWNKVVLRLRFEECLEKHAVGTSVRGHDQPPTVAVIGNEVRRCRGLGRSVVKVMNDRLGFSL